MRKGFFLTESEKNRISNLYGGNKFFLLEAVDPPKDTEQIKDFQKWMDEKYGAWAESKKRPGTYYKVVGSQGYGSFGAQTKKAWESEKGDEYRKEKGGVKSDDKTGQEVWYWYSGQTAIKSTKAEIQTKINNGELTGESFVYNKTKSPQPTKIKTHPTEFEIIPVLNQDGNNAKNDGAKDDEFDDDKTSGVKVDGAKDDGAKDDGTKQDKKDDKSFGFTPKDFEDKNKTTDAGTKYSPIQSNDSTGFTQWYKSIYQMDPLTGTLNTDAKTKKTTYTIDLGNGTQKVYTYDDKNKTWTVPTGQNAGIQLIPKTQ